LAKKTFLDFEQPIAELETKIEELRYVQTESAVDISEEIDQLQKKSQGLLKEIYARLSPWQVSQLARHPQRPYTLDYVTDIFTDFHELHGDRSFSDDLSIVGGLARFNGQAATSRSTPWNGSSSASMKMRPITLSTSTSAPFAALKSPAPAPGVPRGKFNGRSSRGCRVMKTSASR